MDRFRKDCILHQGKLSRPIHHCRCKRGDIGNTSAMYARTFFEELDIDSVTVAPYMGEDSVTPFLSYEGKWVILLALTSNKGSHDFQLTEDTNGERLFEKYCANHKNGPTMKT